MTQFALDAISSIGSTATTKTTGYSAASNEIAKTSEQFMAILLAQLKNQNPMEPMKDNEMMNQMTQLNSLQELQAIKSSMVQLAASSSAGYAASLIGKNIKALLPDGKTVEGLVDGTVMKEGLYLVNVAGKEIPLGSILQVSVPPAQTTTVPAATPPVVDQVHNE
jgi:flagellar basal-body rod modification protein FlgD